ncbi:MAG: type II toxin-antitoxin system HicB family antitoxin [Acidimicrobiales bacterium]
MATVVGQDHVFTQAKRLEQLPARLSEVMRLMTGKRVAPGKWELDIRYDKLTDEAAQLKKMRAEVEEAEAQLAARTAKIARALRAQGMNLRDIGTLTGVSYQRVHQLVS